MATRKNQTKCSIIVPVYNEESNIRLTYDKIAKLDLDSKEYLQIIFVNDGSTDDSKMLLEKIAHENTHVELIHHDSNRGYGASLKSGLKMAKGETIVITDADGTYPIERIPELIGIQYDGGYDMVIGARVGKNVKIPLIRKSAKWFMTKLANYVSGMQIPDLNSGLRVMRREVVEEFRHLLPDGFSFTSTISLAMLTNAYKVKYVPIEYFQRKGRSKIRPIYDTANFVQLIIRTALYFNPMRIFVPLSFFLVLFSVVVLLGSWIFLDRIMDVTFGVILMTAVMVLAIGMLADLINKMVK